MRLAASYGPCHRPAPRSACFTCTSCTSFFHAACGRGGCFSSLFKHFSIALTALAGTALAGTAPAASAGFSRSLMHAVHKETAALAIRVCQTCSSNSISLSKLLCSSGPGRTYTIDPQLPQPCSHVRHSQTAPHSCHSLFFVWRVGDHRTFTDAGSIVCVPLGLII